MRTFFNIVLGILLTVLKASLHALASAAGAIGLCVVAAVGGVYVFRRWSAARQRAAKAAEVIPIDG